MVNRIRPRIQVLYYSFEGRRPISMTSRSNHEWACDLTLNKPSWCQQPHHGGTPGREPGWLLDCTNCLSRFLAECFTDYSSNRSRCPPCDPISSKWPVSKPNPLRPQDRSLFHHNRPGMASATAREISLDRHLCSQRRWASGMLYVQLEGGRRWKMD